MSLICPTEGCGNRFPSISEGGAILVPIVFPREFERLESVLALGPHKVKCRQCGVILEIEPVVVSCMMIPQRTMIIYLPSKLPELTPIFMTTL